MFTANSLPDKILFLKLWVKIHMANHIENLLKFRHKFNFLHGDKNQSFFEADTIVFGGHDKTCPKYPKEQVFAIFLQLLLNPFLIV